MFEGRAHSAILRLAVILGSSSYSTCARLRGFASQEKVGISGTMLAERPLKHCTCWLSLRLVSKTVTSHEHVMHQIKTQGWFHFYFTSERDTVTRKSLSRWTSCEGSGNVGSQVGVPIERSRCTSACLRASVSTSLHASPSRFQECRNPS